MFVIRNNSLLWLCFMFAAACDPQCSDGCVAQGKHKCDTTCNDGYSLFTDNTCVSEYTLSIHAIFVITTCRMKEDRTKYDIVIVLWMAIHIYACVRAYLFKSVCACMRACVYARVCVIFNLRLTVLGGIFYRNISTHYIGTHNNAHYVQLYYKDHISYIGYQQLKNDMIATWSTTHNVTTLDCVHLWCCSHTFVRVLYVKYIWPISVSRYMARLRATGADWRQDTVMIF